MTNPITHLWKSAGQLAEVTPAARNRYVDFLRAASIAVVVLGHWLVAAPHLIDGKLVPGHMLALAPWTQWLTLGVQVMPIFFLVGGFANAVAWQAARRKETPYGEWLGSRIQRLVAPVLPVLMAWIGVAGAAVLLGADPQLVGGLTQVALVPTWFLAVYVMVGVLVPLTQAAWQRFGFASFAGLVAAAVVTDFLAIGLGVRGLGYINYAFVWLAIHQLGYAWQAGRMGRPLVWASAGAAALALLVGVGPYPLAMVGVPGQALGNTAPPTLALLALGITQTGLVLQLEGMAKRMLARRRAWTATVLVNGMIMSLYLWHMTAMILAAAIALLLGGIGLGLVPDSGAWWAARPLWMASYSLVLVPLVAAFMRFERPAQGTSCTSRRRLVTGASLTCFGLFLLSRYGIVGGAGALRMLPSFMPLVGTGLAGFGPLAGLLSRASR